ncbi:MAG TPA: phosphoglycerate dehydrogenase [Thermomicrobiales bacterium]|nr:phosphoglycerate dehydrogenase [Thermomicrobiales bacterium]
MQAQLERPHILVSDPLGQAGLAVLEREAAVDVRPGLAADDLRRILPGYEALIVRSETRVTADLLAAGTALRVVTRAGVGTDNIDVPAATERGIVVLNTPGPNTIAAAEHTFGVLLALLRHIPRADASLRAGRWDRKSFVGHELYGKTLGILGLGRIGREVAARALAFGMDVVAYDPYVPPAVAEALGATPLPLAEVLARADVVTLHLPLQVETRGLLGARELALMKPTARLVNCARGGLVDEAALADALREGRLAGAALDVYEHEPPTGSPLMGLDNVVVTPHLAASSVEAQHGVALVAAETTLAALRGELVPNAVNLPAVAPGELAALRPWLDLAGQLGRLIAGTLDGPPAALEIGFLGDFAAGDPKLIGAAALRGFLLPSIPEQVTLINSRLLAERRGVAVSERFAAVPPEGASRVLELRATACEGANGDTHSHIADGALDGQGHGRLVAVDGFAVTLDPCGRLLLINHRDQPGMIGAVGTTLGRHGVNIAGMQVGRRQARGAAVMIVILDDPLPRAALEQIRAIPGLSHAHYVDLSERQ